MGTKIQTLDLRLPQAVLLEWFSNRMNGSVVLRYDMVHENGCHSVMEISEEKSHILFSVVAKELNDIVAVINGKQIKCDIASLLATPDRDEHARIEESQVTEDTAISQEQSVCLDSEGDNDDNDSFGDTTRQDDAQNVADEKQNIDTISFTKGDQYTKKVGKRKARNVKSRKRLKSTKASCTSSAVSTATSFTCSICNKTDNDKFCLKQHIEANHSNDPKYESALEILGFSFVILYQCFLCEYKCADARRLWRHIKINHDGHEDKNTALRQAEKMEDDWYSTRKQNGAVPCLNCGASSYRIQDHIKAFHPGNSIQQLLVKEELDKEVTDPSGTFVECDAESAATFPECGAQYHTVEDTNHCDENADAIDKISNEHRPSGSNVRNRNSKNRACKKLESKNAGHSAKPITGVLGLDSGNPGITCIFCDLQISDKPSMISHMRTKHADNPGLEEAFETLGCSVKTVYQCFICSYTSNDPRWLWRHIMCSHANHQDKLDALKQAEKLEAEWYSERNRTHFVKCPVCGISTYRIVAHLKVFHSDQPDLQQMIDDYSVLQGKQYERFHRQNKQQKYAQIGEVVCECGKSFVSPRGYDFHRHHVCTLNPERKKKYHCSMCGNKWDTREELEEHKKEKHSGKTQHLCDICGTDFQCRTGLYRHRRLKHGYFKTVPLEAHTCEVCGVLCSSAAKLKDHQTLHTGERNHICEVCGKDFRRKEDVRRHFLSQHKNIYRYHCEKCGHGVDQKKYLKTHRCDRVKRKRSAEPSEEHASAALGYPPVIPDYSSVVPNVAQMPHVMFLSDPSVTVLT